ncbi:MAG: 50S ribosomal protein L11 methyltransferase [Pseudomonadota bacterium]
MTSWSAFTTLPGKAPAEALGAALEAVTPEPIGIGVFEIEDGSGLWEVGSYFTEAPDSVQLDLLAAVHGAKPFTVSEVPDKDWVAEVKRELAPIQAGRFFLYGSHDADRVPKDCVPLLIEAAMAFGTGHHGTTKGCLLEFDKLLTDGHAKGPVLDLGCGTAVLAMAAAKVMKGPILASDIDEVATDTARANLIVNGLDQGVDVVTAAGLNHPKLREKTPYGLIFANILKGPLIELAPEIAIVMGDSGHLILSGILSDQRDETVNSYRNQRFNVINETQIDDWLAITMVKMA